MDGRLGRGITAGASVICGAAVGILSILATADWSLAWIVALAVAVACWIVLEVRRAIAEPGTSGDQISVVQRAGSVLGRMVGARGTWPSKQVDVKQTVNTVGENAEVIGIDGSALATYPVDGKTP